jgi:site-specific recombinase XerD
MAEDDDASPVFDLGEILAAGDAYIPPTAPTDPAAAAASVPAPRENGALPEIRIADGSRRWRQGVSGWLAAQKSKHTETAYRSEAAKWHAWCVTAGADPFAARRKHADVYARGLSGSIASQARALAALSSLYTYLIEEEEPGEAAEEVESNPFKSVKRPKVNANFSPTKALADEDTDKLMAAAEARSPRAAAIIAVLYYTGIRVSELVTADAADLDTERGHRTLKIRRKGGFDSDVVLPAPAAHAVDVYLAGRARGPLIATGSGRPMRRQDVNVLLDSLARAANIGHTHAHRLRHTFAVDAKESGVPIERIQAAMDHADPRTTGRYAGRLESLETAPGYALAVRRAQRAPSSESTPHRADGAV